MAKRDVSLLGIFGPRTATTVSFTESREGLMKHPGELHETWHFSNFRPFHFRRRSLGKRAPAYLPYFSNGTLRHDAV